jgi:hypothetical protein
MVPPLTKDGKIYDANAPVQSWKIVQAFDSAARCEAYRESELQVRSAQPRTEAEAALQAIVNWPGFRLECVATDDPRLAK